MNGRFRILFLTLFFVSGACALIYEISWSRHLTLVFGGTTFAIATVLACFMGGLALGSWIAGRLSRRISRPLLIYGFIEIAVGLYCLAVPWLLSAAEPLYLWFLEAETGSTLALTVARIAVSGLIFILPTTLMGATLPLLARGFAAWDGRSGEDVAQLYGINTIGAFVGTVLAGFLLLPMVGLRAAIWIAAGLNLAAGMAAIAASRQDLLGTDALAKPIQTIETLRPNEDRLSPKSASLMNPAAILIVYGISGFAAMAYQVAWTRALILSLGSSTYAFSAIVACFILGLAVGSLLMGRELPRIRRPLLWAGALEALIALSALLIVPLFSELPGMVSLLSESPGATWARVFSLELFIVFGLLIVPTLCMGALMPLVCMIYDPRPESIGRSVGDVYASNTFGTILGSAAAGFILIPLPAVGMQRTIFLASALSAIAATVFLLGGRKPRGAETAEPATAGESEVATSTRLWPRLAAVASLWIVGAGLLAVSSPWSRSVMVMGPYLGRGYEPEEVVYYREDVDTTVAVTRTGADLTLRVNGKPDASTSDLHTQYLLALVPLLHQPDAKDLCVIGLGSGATAGAALSFPVRRVDVAEISDGVIEAAEFFDPIAFGVLRDPRVNVYRADGRNLLMLEERQYDVIISEPSNPWISGVANLYTREFFELCQSRLRTGGIHAQWIHGYSISSEEIGSVLATMGAVFNDLQIWELGPTDYLVLGSDKPIELNLEQAYVHFARPEAGAVFDRLNLNTPMQLAYHFLGDVSDAREWAEGQPVMTDDLPLLEFTAPKSLLKHDLLDIQRRIAALDGEPRLVEDGGNELRGGFRRELALAREGQDALLNVYTDLSLARQPDRSDVRDVATSFPGDVRKAIWLVGLQLSQSEYLLSPHHLRPTKNDLFFASLRRQIPDFPAFQQAAVGRPHQLSHWPFVHVVGPPQSPDARRLLAEAQELNRKRDYAVSLEKARQSAEFDAGNPQVHCVIAANLLAMKKFDEARVALLKAFVRNPSDVAVAHDLSLLYRLEGNPKIARIFELLSIQRGEGGARKPAAISDARPAADSGSTPKSSGSAPPKSLLQG